MHEDLIYIGPYPCDEDGVQTVDADYARNAKVECRAFIDAIRKVCGREPDGARLTVKADRYDDGNMLYEVVVQFDGRNEKAVEYAFNCEANAPATWEAAGMEAPTFGRGAEAMRRLAKFSLLLLAATAGGYGVGKLDGHDRPLEHMEKPWVVRAMGL